MSIFLNLVRSKEIETMPCPPDSHCGQQNQPLISATHAAEEALKRQKVDGAGYKSVAFSYGEAAGPGEADASGVAASGAPLTTSEVPAAETFWPPYPVPEELRETMVSCAVKVCILRVSSLWLC
jgi:hypothetical protein